MARKTVINTTLWKVPAA